MISIILIIVFPMYSNIVIICKIAFSSSEELNLHVISENKKIYNGL